jgi:hypothetical protein
MTTEYPISGAREADALVIASLFALSWTSPFTRLQFGNIDPPSLAAAMAPRVAEQMKKENCRFLVARHPETYELAAVAHWTISHDDDDATTEETPEEIEERQLFDDEAFRNKLPESSNRALIMEFTVGLRGLRERTLAGKKHFSMYICLFVARPERHPRFTDTRSAGEHCNPSRPSRERPGIQTHRMGFPSGRRARSPGLS